MADTTETLTGRQERAIIALINEPNIPKAALTAKVGERTLYRWIKQSPFKAALRETRRESFTQAIALEQGHTVVHNARLAEFPI